MHILLLFDSIFIKIKGVRGCIHSLVSIFLFILSSRMMVVGAWMNQVYIFLTLHACLSKYMARKNIWFVKNSYSNKKNLAGLGSPCDFTIYLSLPTSILLLLIVINKIYNSSRRHTLLLSSSILLLLSELMHVLSMRW